MNVTRAFELEAALNVFSDVSKCAEVELPLESCLVMTFLKLAMEKDEVNFIPDTCGPPQITKLELEELMLEANSKCRSYGKDVGSYVLEDYTNQVNDLFGNNTCWGEFCEGIQNDLVGDMNEDLEEIENSIKQSIVDTVAGCTGSELSVHSCVVSTSLDLFLAGVIGPNGEYYSSYYHSDQSENFHRALEGKGSIADAICVLPPIDDSIIMKIIDDAKEMCIATGQEASSDEVAEVKDVISALVGDSSCVLPMCKEPIEDGLATVKSIIVDTVAGCTGSELSVHSCVVSSFLDMMFIEMMGGNRDYNENDNIQRLLRVADTESPQELCSLPQLENEDITRMVRNAEQVCIQAGKNEDENNDADDIIEVIQRFFNGDSCLSSICEETLNIGIEAFQSYNLKNVALGYIFDCAGIEIDSSSCLQNSLLEEILHHDRNMGHEEEESNMHRRVVRARRVKTRNHKLNRFLNAPTASTKSPTTSTKAPIALSSKAPAASTKAPIGVSSKAPSRSSTMAPINDERSPTRAPSPQYDEWASTKTPSISSTKAPNYISSSSKAPTYASSSKAPSPSRAPSHQHNQSFCPVHHFDQATLYTLVNRAEDRCLQKGVTESAEARMKAIEMMKSLSKAKSCWDATCSEDSWLTIASTSLRSCLRIDLPISITDPLTVQEGPYEYEEDRKLACMVKVALSDPMNTEANSQEHCFPPFFNEIDAMKDACTYYTGPMAYDQCSEQPDMYGSYEHSHHNDNSDKMVLDLCFILQRLSSKRGQECLSPLCHLKETLERPGDYESDQKQEYPSSVPSAFASAAPSSDDVTLAPSSSEGQSQPENGSFEVKFEAAITLRSIDVADIPTSVTELEKMFKVLEKAILKFLPQDTQVRIVSVGGISIGRRRLEEGVEVEFEVIVMTECETNDCAEANEKAKSVYEERTRVFQDVLTDGELVAAIQTEASEEGIAILETVTVDTDSFQAEEMKLTVRTDQDGDTDDDVSSANKLKIVTLLYATIVGFCVRLLFWS